MNSALLTDLENFFAVSPYMKRLSKCYVRVIRKDGVVLYGHRKLKNSESVGALMGGMWQAANALRESLDVMSGGEQEFKLSFDKSSDGFLILPFKMAGETYFLGAIYRDQVNPGRVKAQLKLIAGQLERAMAKQRPKLERPNTKRASSTEKDFLFDSISDDEIDSMFSFGRQ